MSRATMAADLVLTKTLDDLFRDHRQMLWGLSYRMTGCAADAEDIVQETFARAATQPTPLHDHVWRPWLMRVATNLVVSNLTPRGSRCGSNVTRCSDLCRCQ